MGGRLRRTLAPRERVLEEGAALERALFGGRVLGGAILFFLGPLVTNGGNETAIRALGVYFVAYAVLMLRVARMAHTAHARQRAALLAHVFDTAGFLAAIVLDAVDPQWLVSYAAPLYVFVAVTRLGALGGLTAASAVAITHVAMSFWRTSALGIPFDLPRTLVYVSIYALAALLTIAVDSELRALRARREIQLAVHEPLLRAHDELGQGVVVMENGRPIYVSDGFLALAGLSRAEAMALPDLQALLSDDGTGAPAPVREGMNERTITRKGGERRDVEVALRRYSAQDRTRAVAIVSDVTLRKQALEELERKQRLDSLGSLAGGIAHDFNNLLAAVANNAYLALETPGVAPVRREIEEIGAAAERGIQLTRQMLAFARGGRSTAGPVDIRSDISATEHLLRRTLGSDIDLDVRLAPILPLVRCEPGQIEQILMNLVLNARDAITGRGHIVIEVDRERVAAADTTGLAPGAYVRIVVRDDGAGMTPEVAAHAFEPFFSTKPKDVGTGLGLATVEGIAERAGGQVDLASQVGHGTTVTVRLPVAEAPKRVPIAAPTREATSPNVATILVVDDMPAVRRTTAEILRRTGYRVIEASTPAEARSAAGDADLVVCDVVLPEISGTELAKELRRAQPGLRVIFMSGYAPAEAGGSPEDPFIGKPFSPDALLAAVRSALRGERSGQN